MLLNNDNASFHHKAFAQIAIRWAYYSSANIEQCINFGEHVAVEALSPSTVMVLLLELSTTYSNQNLFLGVEDRRDDLMAPAGMAIFQPCEAFFLSLKKPNGAAPEKCRELVTSRSG